MTVWEGCKIVLLKKIQKTLVEKAGHDAGVAFVLEKTLRVNAAVLVVEIFAFKVS